MDQMNEKGELAKNSIQFRIGGLTKAIFKRLNTELVKAKIPILAEQIPVLLVVFFHKTPVSQNEIAGFLAKDKSAIQRSVKTLVREGLLRIEGDIHDKRRNHVLLTSSGRFVCEKIQDLSLSFNAELRKHFSDEEWNNFYAMMDRILKLIG